MCWRAGPWHRCSRDVIVIHVLQRLARQPLTKGLPPPPSPRSNLFRPYVAASVSFGHLSEDQQLVPGVQCLAGCTRHGPRHGRQSQGTMSKVPWAAAAVPPAQST